jgi:NMD protein affecting ribosome stability and mRNA decay
MCGRIFLGDNASENVEAAVENFLSKVLRQKDVESATYRIDGSSLFITIDISVDGLKKEVERKIPIVNKTITCKFCNLKKASYYNVTIQVRVPKSVEQKVISDIEREISRLNKSDSYSFISGTENLKEGVDVFVGSKSAAEHVVDFLKRRYKIKTKTSRKLYGLVEGKKSYRDTVLVSMSE